MVFNFIKYIVVVGFIKLVKFIRLPIIKLV